MDLIKKSFTVLLAILTLSLYFPNISFAEKELLMAQAQITKHRPQIVSTPEEDIPTEMVKKTRMWPCCVGVGLAAVAGIAVAAGGDEEDDGNGTSGDITVTW